MPAVLAPDDSGFVNGIEPCAAGVADPGRGLPGWEVGSGRREEGDGSGLICSIAMIEVFSGSPR